MESYALVISSWGFAGKSSAKLLSRPLPSRHVGGVLVGVLVGFIGFSVRLLIFLANGEFKLES
jgi:VIT1/CCC1 family predicted Fe2+/Mn2+ transporter